jgi:hypothetical protein
MKNVSKPNGKWTVMVYMVADTGDSFYQAAMKNITEMAEARFDDRIRVVVHADAPSPWRTKCWEVKGASGGKKGEATEISCGRSCLLDFVEKCMNSYESDHYLLVLWGHGEGIDWKKKVLGKRETMDSIIGVGKRFAPGSAGVMEVGELGKALKELHLKEDIKDNVLLGFDACLMGMVEVYYEIREYVGWAVAANDEIPDTGWPYKDILSQLGNDPEIRPETLAGNIVEECKNWYSHYSPGSKVSFSACNLATSDALSSAAKKLTNELRKRIKEDSVRNAIGEARDFAEDLREEAYVDLNAFCSELKRQADKSKQQAKPMGNGPKPHQLGDAAASGIQDAASNVIKALKGFAFKHGLSDEYPYKYWEHSRAVSICFPKSADLTGSVPGIAVDWTSYEHLDFSKATEWPDLMKEFWDR